MIYVGVDIGDGETAVTACFWSNGTLTPYELKLDEFGAAIPSLLAVHPQSGRTLIGRSAVYIPSQGPQSELFVNFKNAPSAMAEKDRVEFQRKVVLFINTLFSEIRCLRDLWQMAEQNEYVFCFGHPTTWTQPDIDIYVNIIRQAEVFCQADSFFGRSGVSVALKTCKESHAALLNLAHRQLGKMNGGDENDIVKWVPEGCYLVTIDWGSSTTDITTIINNNGKLSVLPDGEDGNGKLGARYLDRAIYEAVVKRLSSDERKHLEAYLDANPSEKGRMKVFCRFAKEAYFNASDEQRAMGGVGVLNPPGGAPFPLSDVFAKSCEEIMNEALNAPVPEFGNLSWKEECRALLKRVHESCSRRGSTPKVIYLTGGASRMNFIFEMTTELFPNARVHVDSFPSVCIANGLALMPYKLEGAQQFLQAVHRFVDLDIPPLVEAKLSDLANDVAEKVTPGICDVAKSEMRDWRNGHTKTLNGMESKIKDHVASHLQTVGVKDAIEKAVGSFYENNLLPSVNSRFNAICEKYKIKPRRLNCSQSVEVKNCGGGVGSDVTKDMQGVIVDRVGTAVIAAIATCIGVVILALTGVISAPIAAAIGTAVVNAIVAVITTMGITAPVLAPLAILVATVMIFGGIEALKDKLRTIIIPLCVRDILVSDAKIDSVMADNKWNVKSEIASGIRNSSEYKTKVAKSIKESLKRQFEQNAQDLALHIYD